MRELKSTQPFVQFMAADGVKQTGKVSKTGQRADLMFTYKDNDLRIHEGGADVKAQVL